MLCSLQRLLSSDICKATDVIQLIPNAFSYPPATTPAGEVEDISAVVNMESPQSTD